jgi:hypothetical protein
LELEPTLETKTLDIGLARSSEDVGLWTATVMLAFAPAERDVYRTRPRREAPRSSGAKHQSVYLPKWKHCAPLERELLDSEPSINISPPWGEDTHDGGAFHKHLALLGRRKAENILMQ